MKFSTTFGAAVCAGAALAAPSPTRRSTDVKKLQKIGNSHPNMPFQSTGRTTNSKADSQSSNWSGAAKYPASGEVITSVQATFPVPTPSVPDGADPGSYSGASWIGIDGTNGGASLWQAGTIWTVDNSAGDPTYSYGVWYEWLPNALVVIDDFPVAAGDSIYVNLTSQSATDGTVVIADNTSGQTTTITTSAPSPTDTLLGVSAEWITEDFSSNGGLVAFANYGSVAFTDVQYGSTSGTFDADGGDIIDLVDSNGNVLSQGAIPSGGEVDTTYE